MARNPYQLVADLGVFAEAFEAAGDDIKAKQAAIIASLTTAVSLLECDPEVRQHLAPLHALMLAMDRVVGGGSDRLLQGAGATPGGRPLDTSQELLQHHAVGAVQVLIDCGHQEKVAVFEVATILAGAGARGRSGSEVTPSMIRGWRSKAASGDYPAMQARASEVSQIVREAWQLLGQVWPPSRAQAVQALSQVLSSDVATFAKH